MPESAAQQLNRIVTVVAELSRREAVGEEPATLDELARAQGVEPRRILLDLRVLTQAGDDPENTWLSSLRAYQEGDRVSVSSLGPYRRPIRFTSEELLSLRVALATESEPASDELRELAGMSERDVIAETPKAIPVPFLRGDQAAVTDLARVAMNDCRRLRIVYAGEGAREATERVVHPHDVVIAEGKCYMSAWCERAGDWRLFRADRVLEAALADGSFERRAGAPDIERAGDLLRIDEEDVDHISVRFSPHISRWIRERYPEAKEQEDGSVVVVFRTASVDWLVRSVLQYGAEAEVLGPRVYREAVRRAVS